MRPMQLAVGCGVGERGRLEFVSVPRGVCACLGLSACVPSYTWYGWNTANGQRVRRSCCCCCLLLIVQLPACRVKIRTRLYVYVVVVVALLLLLLYVYVCMAAGGRLAGGVRLARARAYM